MNFEGPPLAHDHPPVRDLLPFPLRRGAGGVGPRPWEIVAARRLPGTTEPPERYWLCQFPPQPPLRKGVKGETLWPCCASRPKADFTTPASGSPGAKGLPCSGRVGSGRPRRPPRSSVSLMGHSNPMTLWSTFTGPDSIESRLRCGAFSG